MEYPTKTLIIVAGGSGTRMQSEVPKQFLSINNEIILMRTIRIFHEFDSNISIIVALPKTQIEGWEKLCIEMNFKISHQIVEGGETRFHSVKNALVLASKSGIIAVHDGVRPLVSNKTIERVFDVAVKLGNAVPFMDIHESMRYVTGDSNQIVDRNNYKIIQTPQAFKADLVKDAYQQDYMESFTDDASVVENAGTSINLIPGNRENIKITSPDDLKIAHAFLC